MKPIQLRVRTYSLSLLIVSLTVTAATAQPQTPAPNGVEMTASQAKESQFIERVIRTDLEMTIDPTRSQLIRTKVPISRMSITNPDILDVTQFAPNEIELMGLKSGETSLTLWFGAPDAPNSEVLRYLVRVLPDRGPEDRAEQEFGQLQRRINEMFPNSHVQLIPIADKLIVRGQARDSQEASQIISVIRGQAVDQTGDLSGGLGTNPVTAGRVATLPGAADLPTTQVINMLNVPGEHQVMLKVRIAEITRTALRQLGLDFNYFDDNFEISQMFGVTPNLSAILDGGDVELFIQAFSGNGYGKVLAEPTLVTLSGQTARFIAGGEFAVPTAVGIDGIAAASTRFRGFGTQLLFTPTVLDKDRVRLHVVPSFTSVNEELSVDGIPGLNTRAVATTVDLREGQWLAVAGLIQDEQGGSRARLPGLGDIPLIGAAFGDQEVRRDETELVVMVSPELVHPMESEQVPLMLPGMDVKDPTDAAFYLHQRIEGAPWCDHRSTVWPAYRHLLHDAKKQAAQDARAFGKLRGSCHTRHEYYINGPVGFSK